MPFPVLGSNSAVAEFAIDNSLRFNDDDSPKLQRTTGSNGDRQKFTFSAWVKKAQDTGDDQTLFSANDGGHQPHIRFDTSEQLNVRISNSASYNVKTNQLFRDCSAWYHIVVNMDTTQSTASNRIKIFVNGSQVTSLATANYPTQNYNSPWNSNTEHTLGRDVSNNDNPFDGYISELFWVDGTAYDASTFGEYNNNGVWIPKDAKDDISFGTHGFYFQFQDSSNLGDDTSGNTNDFTATNLTATDQTTDTPTNNFCTLNSLANFGGATLSEGNTKNVTPSPAGNGLVPATMGVKSGKWYWEINVSTTNFVACGIIADDRIHGQVTGLTKADSLTRVVKGDDGTKFSSNTSGGSYMAAYEGSILQVALNLDDGEITFGAGGSWANGSGATNQTFANSTPAYTDLNSSSDFTNKFILPAIADENQGTSDTMEVNFGNPSFTISSGNSDANGYGNFEYAVPSGYYALCTKNLAEYG